MQDHSAVIEAARQLGDASRGGDTQLWTEVLEYFGSQDWDCTAQARLSAAPAVSAGTCQQPSAQKLPAAACWQVSACQPTSPKGRLDTDSSPARLRGPAQVQEVLAHIEAGDVLPPMVVLQALARNRHLTLAVVKGYIERQLTQARRLCSLFTSAPCLGWSAAGCRAWPAPRWCDGLGGRAASWHRRSPPADAGGCQDRR